MASRLRLASAPPARWTDPRRRYWRLFSTSGTPLALNLIFSADLPLDCGNNGSQGKSDIVQTAFSLRYAYAELGRHSRQKHRFYSSAKQIYWWLFFLYRRKDPRALSG